MGLNLIQNLNKVMLLVFTSFIIIVSYCIYSSDDANSDVSDDTIQIKNMDNTFIQSYLIGI
jgi:hypothetical protein